MKERILMVCIGQGGSNLGQLFENKKYNCLFVNSAYTDLVPIKAKHKLHIVGTDGCNKDRQKAVKYAQESYYTIENTINTKFPMQDIVFFIFTMGGGTGSGFAPLMLEYMAKKYPTKHFGAIPVLPSRSEVLKPQINAIECYKELRSISSFISIDMLDNSNTKPRDYNYDEFNKDFFERFDRLINITRPDRRGVVDGAELETILTCKGSRYIDVIPSSKFSKSGLTEYKNVNNFTRTVDITNRMIDKMDTNPYTHFEIKKCKYIAMSLADDNIMEDGLKSLVGVPLDTFKGYNEQVNLVVFAGQPMPKKAITELFNNVKKVNAELISMEERDSEQVDEDFELGDINVESLYETKNVIEFPSREIEEKEEVEEVEEELDLDLESEEVDVMAIFNKYAKK